MPTFSEFFAGGGLVREGLGAGWRCRYALDWSEAKADTYRANFGDGELHVRDIRDVAATDLPGVDLATASFPCQDHSSAGLKPGFHEGERGVLVFQFLALMAACIRLGTAPRIILLENVLGLLAADGGRDFGDVMAGLASLGFRVGPLVADAIHFVPQSRPRVFIVAVAPQVAFPAGLVAPEPQAPHHPPALVRAVHALPPPVAQQTVWWRLPAPLTRMTDLADIVERFGSGAECWRNPENVAMLLGMCRPADQARLDVARRAGHPVYGTVTSKPGKPGDRRYLSVRLDGAAPCLMGKTDLRYQQMLRVDGDEVGIRPATINELARMTGIRPGYVMPPTVARAARLTGEGVAVPVVRWLAQFLLNPIAASTVTERAVRRKPGRARRDLPEQPRRMATPAEAEAPGAIVRLLPRDLDRLQDLAGEHGITLDELLLRGADRMLMERGRPPVRRARPAGRAERAPTEGEGDMMLRRTSGRHFRQTGPERRVALTRVAAARRRCPGRTSAARRKPHITGLGARNPGYMRIPSLRDGVHCRPHMPMDRFDVRVLHGREPTSLVEEAARQTTFKPDPAGSVVSAPG